MWSWGKSVSGNKAAHEGAETLKSYTPPHVQAAPFTVVNTGWRLACLGLFWPIGVAVQLQERTLQSQSVYGLIALLGVLAVLLALRFHR